MTISERIYKIMQERGMTQLEFSERTGIPQSTISDWKRKKTNPSVDKLVNICGVLGITPNDLLLNERRDLKKENKSDFYERNDFIIVTEGTDRYELLVEYDRLKSKDKDRLWGYLQALKSSDEKSR